MQNTLARVVLRAPWSVSATDLRRQLHWLPVRQWIHFKLATITYKTMMSDHPSYLHDQLSPSIDQEPSFVHRTSAAATSCQDCFRCPGIHRCCAAPKLWNSLSARTRSANTSATFRSRLKTELFSVAYY